MNSNATFAMTHFVKLCYNVFILENKIDAPVFKKICVKMYYIMLEIALIFVNMKRVSFKCQERKFVLWNFTPKANTQKTMSFKCLHGCELG